MRFKLHPLGDEPSWLRLSWQMMIERSLDKVMISSADQEVKVKEDFTLLYKMASIAPSKKCFV